MCPQPDPSPPPQPLPHAAPPPVQVVHCRRVLKWTYAIAYYTFEETVGGLACLVWLLLLWQWCTTHLRRRWVHLSAVVVSWLAPPMHWSAAAWLPRLPRNPCAGRLSSSHSLG